MEVNMLFPRLFYQRVKISHLTALLVFSLMLILPSCYPGDPISTSDADVVLTYRDKDAVFSNKTSYAMPDSVLYITEDGLEAGDNPLVDNTILSAIKRNMTEAGYSRANNPDSADVIVVALATKTTWVGGGCYPWYWDWWWGYPGWCYPYTYSYTTGTIFINMFDTDQQNSKEKQIPIWLAAMNGIADGSASATRIDRAINQAFAQSPYLGEGK